MTGRYLYVPGKAKQPIDYPRKMATHCETVLFLLPIQMQIYMAWIWIWSWPKFSHEETFLAT